MENGILFQGFEWYLPDDGLYYKRMNELACDLKKTGFSAIWIPPVCKGTSTKDVGYGIYDLYDLGEFNQKGAVRTKYGTVQELLDMIQTFHDEGLEVYADVVMNHMAGADRAENFKAIKTDANDRNKELEGPREIKAWTAFEFLGRGDKYSDFKWNFNHFSGVDYDQIKDEKAIFRIIGENKGWNLGVSEEKGNYDYLMFADIDHAHPDVKKEFEHWANWFIKKTGVDGFRLDAVKHIDVAFMNGFKEYIKSEFGKTFLMLGEYWSNDRASTENYLERTDYDIQLFDVGLHFNFYKASVEGSAYDLRQIFDNTLVSTHPNKAVTFVDNHDSQRGQALQSWVEDWFKEIAYALILLTKKGYPCVFYGDYFGTQGSTPFNGIKGQLDNLITLRKKYFYGEQTDYSSNENLIGWIRHGNEENPYKAAVVISNKDSGSIRMHIGEEQKGKRYRDYLDRIKDEVIIDDEGYGLFSVEGASVSAWIEASLFENTNAPK